MTTIGRICGAGLLALSLGACERARQDMYDQPKYEPFERSDLFADGNSSRQLPQNSVPYFAPLTNRL